ncbi:hypothetical protein [Robertmurraya andreesenii]|uniref:Uncharacterized protein n=1 Tax=Anoxybacillus andreesenii TaxID=1325932 RepID=A0ABT9V299_9BACL|nr:hypothetical protein [Robertmurraya andreesenii]MDQ0155082.1 hypothetical protein [Robertmurraya andreesenii]
MLQVVELNEQLRDYILNLETASSVICSRLEERYRQEFEKFGVEISIEFLRTRKGKMAESNQIFEEHYESYIEIGIEEEQEYFPNAYIPIWRCRKEMFQNIGYLTKNDPTTIEKKINCLVEEMIHDRIEETDRNHKIDE